MATADDVIWEARSLVGAPVIHRGRTRAGGVDCLGLIILSGVSAGVLDPPDEVNWPYAEYGRLPNPRRLVETLNHFLTPIDLKDAGPADVISISWGARDLPMHLAIRAEFEQRASMIHAYAVLRPPRVVEISYAGDWVERTCGAWRYPGLIH